MSFSFSELESMALDARKQMGAKKITDPVAPLKISIEGVRVITIENLKNVPKDISKYLLEDASTEWSAMGVPLDPNFETWVIVRNHKHDLERQRISLLEEFWHIMLGRSLVRIVKVGNNQDEHIIQRKKKLIFLHPLLYYPKKQLKILSISKIEIWNYLPKTMAYLNNWLNFALSD